jgi:antitoxin component of RelBE/YafQ-DinJ toxin-antitoxin module
MKTEPLQFMIPTELKMWLQDYADDYGVSMASVIRIALTQFRRQERIVRETVIADEQATRD